MSKHAIAIIGGGMAGLSAAATLIEQNQNVTLFEASSCLGGRARGLDYKGLRIDNGQHILLGAYHETLALIKRVGIDEIDAIKRLPLTLSIVNHSSAHQFNFKAHPALAAPLHIAWGLLGAKGVTLAEKLSALYFVLKLKLCGFGLKQDISVAKLLEAHKQSPNFVQYLWEPLCLAALNTPPDRASAQVFLNVMRDSFTKKRSDADALLPKTDLSALISAPVANYLRKNDCIIKTNHTINAIVPTQSGYLVQTADSSQRFSHVILACGPHQLKSFAPSLPKLAAQTKHFVYQPITTIYLQYSQQITLNEPMIGVVNGLSQWVFDHGLISGQKGLIAVVISAHTPFTKPKKVIAQTIAEELKQLFPSLTKPKWHKIITEKRATFSCDANLIRPDNITDYPNLLLAGDFTQSDYPATIEGAVRSGIKAARQLSL